MNICQKLLRLAGKENFKLDEQIGLSYLIAVCWKYAWMLLRGSLFSLGNSKIKGRIFLGKKVKVKCKKNLVVGRKCKLHDGVEIDALSTTGVTLGNCVVLGRNSRIECTGSLNFVGRGCSIGDNSAFGSECFFGAAGGIIIGKDVIAGQNVRFHSENHLFADSRKLIREQGVSHKGIIVGNNCWIGAGAVFLDGAEIGDGCVVGANAVITKKFPDNCVIAGVPAKVIGKRGNT